MSTPRAERFAYELFFLGMIHVITDYALIAISVFAVSYGLYEWLRFKKVRELMWSATGLICLAYLSLDIANSPLVIALGSMGVIVKDLLAVSLVVLWLYVGFRLSAR